MAIMNGTSGDDTLLGTEEEDTIYGYDGNDILYTGTGANTDGTSNKIYAGNGDDTIFVYGASPSSGGNSIYGDAGNDSFIWNPLSWRSNIYDSSGSYDTIVFTDGISFDDLTIFEYGSDVRINGMSTTNYMYLKGQASQTHIERLAFEDGTTYSLNGTTATRGGPRNSDSVLSYLL